MRGIGLVKNCSTFELTKIKKNNKKKWTGNVYDWETHGELLPVRDEDELE